MCIGAQAAIVKVPGGVPGHRVVACLHGTRAGSLIDPVSLGAVVGPRIGNLVSFDDKVGGMRLDIKAISFAGVAIIKNFVVSKYVAAAAVLHRLVAKVYAGKTVTRNGVPNKLVVGVFVPNGNAVMSVIFNYVVLESAVPDPPAKKRPMSPLSCMRQSFTRGLTLPVPG